MAEFKFREIEETQVNDSQNVKTSGFSFREIEDTTDYTKLKANEIFSIDGSNTDAPNKLNKVNKSWMQKFYDSDIAKFGETQSKAVVRGLYETAGGVGSLISWYGDNMIMPKGAFGLEDKTIDRLNTFGRGWQKFGQIIKDGSEFVLNDEGLKLDEEIFDKDIISNPSLTRVSAAVMSAAPSLMSMVGITKATGSTALSYFLMGGVDSSDIYDAAKEKGYDMEKTNLLYTSSMAGTALIDKMLSPVEKILGGKATTIGKKIANRVVSGLSEGFAEGSQTVWQNFVTQYGIDDAQDLMEGVFEAIIGGFGAGAVASGMFEQTSTKLKEKGATQEEIDNIVNVAGDYVSKNADEINGIAFQTLDKGIGELNKFIEAHKGTPEAEKAIQTKKELDEVYNNVYTELEKLGAKEVADSQAKVIQGITLWGSQATGMSPMEYYNKRMPKVQAMDYQEFVKKYQTNVVSDALKVDARKEGIALLQADLDKLKSGKYGKNEAKKVSLSQFLKSKGGIKESGGELKNIGANKQVVGLVNNKSGMTLDEATHLAWENGYIQSTERPEINTLLDLLADDVSGTHKVYKVEDATNNDSELRYFEELSRALSEANVDLNKDSVEVAYDKLEAYSKKLQDAEIDRQVEALDEDAQERFYMMVENGVSKADAYDSLNPKYDDDYIPFQESLDVAKQNAELDKVNPKYEGETININGVEKTVYNSNGDRIAMSEPALQNFYNWFGDSKVVDEQGRPKVMYHGTRSKRYGRELPEFDVFSRDKLRSLQNRVGFFFGETESFAKVFGDRVMPVYLKMNNPKIYKKGTPTSEELALEQGAVDKATGDDKYYAQKILNDSRKYTDAYDKFVMDIYHKSGKIPYQNRKDGNFNDAVYLGSEESFDIADTYTEKMQEDGFDGVIILNTEVDANSNQGKPNTQYVVFEPNQIKSTSNRGTYSESDNIYYQGGEVVNNDLINRTDKSKYLTDEEVKAVEKDYKDFEANITKMIDGTLSPHTRLIVLNKLPSPYNNIPELKGKKLIINQNIYKKIIDLPNPYKNHNIDRKRAIKMPFLVADPNYILQSTSKGHEDRFEIVTNSRGNGKGQRLSIIIQPNSDAVVVSGYDEAINISKAKEEKRVLYDKNKEVLKTNVTSKATAINTSYEYTITPNSEKVNSKVQFQEGEERNLVAVHSIGASNLEKAIDLGGFPVPSIAIINKEQEFYFDEQPITLVGNKEMIDPKNKKNEVYNRDIWSITFPTEEYKVPKQSSIDKFRKKYAPYFNKVLDSSAMSSLLYTVGFNPRSAMNEFSNSLGAKLYYVENVLKENFDVPLKDRSLEQLKFDFIDADETFVNDLKDIDINFEWNDEVKSQMTKAVKDALERTDFSKYGKHAERMKKAAQETLFDDDGVLNWHIANNMVKKVHTYLKMKGKLTADYYEIRDLLNDKIKDKNAYEKWATDEFRENLIGEPLVEVGKKLLPRTLENITKAMVNNATVNGQNALVYGSGKVIAAGAKKLNSIKEIKTEGKKLVSQEEQREVIKQLEEDMSDFTNQFMTASDFSSSMTQKEAAYRALGSIAAKETPTTSDLQKILNYELDNKKVYNKEILEAGVKIANSVKNLSRYYFEAKPQRAVTLQEFSAAIIPTSSEFDAIASKVESNGLKVIRSDNQIEAIRQLDNVYFQGEQSAPRGAFIENLDGKGVIFLFEKADASTFMHETAHFFRKELREFGDAKSLKMLNKVEQWENQEFDSRYNVEYVDGKYNVTDKHGDNVYTGFNSISQAREYGRNEIFARGFEAYLREGKAPNNYLKQAFRNFWSWLRSLVKTAKDLKVELNDDIKSVYAEILGGEDLDFYLSSSPDEFIQKRTATEIARRSILDGEISKAQASKVKKGRFDGVFKEKTESAKDRNKWWKNAMIPLSTRAKRVNQGLKNKLRAYDYRTYTKLNEYLARIQPFVEKWATFEENDAIAFDLALKNGYVEKQVEIVNKYNAYDEYIQMKDLLNHLFDEAIKVQINLGYTADYFPRQIEDVDGFMTYIYGSEMASQMRRAIKEAGLEGATNEMKAEFVNKYLRGFNRVDLNKPLIGNTKDRTIDIVTAELNQFYKPSMQALFSYIDGMNNSIESRKYFGFDMENIDQSIGAYVDGLIMNGLIKPEDDAEVRSILQARFKAKGVTNKYLKTMKNLSYIYTMGGINSAITQIDDLSVAIYKAGFWNTVNSIFSKNKEGLTREDLGLERIGQEFVEASSSSKAVSEVFKLTGLDKIDAFGKNTLINATFDKFQKLANENPKQLEELIAPIMENETKQTIEDIKNGVISDNVKLLMFNELADVQPIALSEMPEYYLTSGNGRVFYMLKTFMVRRIDIFRNECFDKIRKGEVKEGVQNLFKLSVLMILMGMTKDRIIDFIFGRDFDLSDAIVNNVLGLVGMSKYSLYKARNEGASGLISSMAVPPLFAPLSDLSVDLYKSLFSKKGKDISDYEVWKGVPLIGRFYYWWLGGGRTKIEKKTKKKLK